MVLWTQNPQTSLKHRDPVPVTLDCGGCNRTRALSQADLGSNSGSASIYIYIYDFETPGYCFLIYKMKIVTAGIVISDTVWQMPSICLIRNSLIWCLNYYATRLNRNRMGNCEWACCAIAMTWGFGASGRHADIPIISTLLFDFLQPGAEAA